MYDLIIDSATGTLYLCLLNNNQVIDERYIIGKNDHSKNIVSNVEEMLKRFNLNVSDLNKIICGVGPGSYTGVRMGVTVSKMLSVFSNVRLYEVSSLYIMSSFYEGKILSIIDARRGNGFCAVIDYDNIVKELVVSKESIIEEYKGFQVITEDMYKVNPFKVIAKSREVIDPHGLVPNYLRETEAERNLHD